MKAIETERNYKESVTMLKTQIKSMKSLIKLDKAQAEIIKPIIVEKKTLLEYISRNKIWNFNFKGGGWNSNSAKTMEKAIKLAKKEYNRDGNTFEYRVTNSDGTRSTKIGTNKPLRVDPNSFRVATEADTKSLLSSFY